MGKVFAVINQKGGVGKTTTVFNMAAELTNRGYKVLAMDIDPQANLTSYMGYDENEVDTKFTIAEIFNLLIQGAQIKNLNQYILKRNKIDLIPSSIVLAKVETAMMLSVAREYLLKKIVTPLRDSYDYILIDCPPTLGLLVINILTAADEVIIPIKAAKMNVNGFEGLLNIIEMIKQVTNPKLYISGVLITMFDPRFNAAKRVVEYLQEFCPQYNISIYKTRIGNSTMADLAFDDKKTLAEYDSRAILAKQYFSFTEEVLKIGKE